MSAPRRAAATAFLPFLLHALALGAAAPWPGAALASTEEFSTFDVERPEEDDESLLDHRLTAAPRAWESEWRRAPMAVRTLQGCLTSGQWFNRTSLRTAAPMGERARFGVELDVAETDLSTWSQVDFTFRFPQRFGTPGAMFRPYYDKSRQDFAITYEAGGDSTAFDVAAAFTFEDLFNNLWAWRQTRVGDTSEAYERHPFEPALRLGSRGSGWRAEAGGKWLSPSRKRAPDPASPRLDRLTTLWGTHAEARVETRALGLEWEVSAENRQARGTESAATRPGAAGPLSAADSAALATGDDAGFRRLWSAALVVRRGGASWSAAASWTYQSRTQTWAPPTGPGRFDALDRVVGLEVTRRLTATLELRVGALLDRIGVARSGVTPGRIHATRDEKRLYFGLDARFGNVRAFGLEGLELDREPYDVWGIHDKGFLGLQATF